MEQLIEEIERLRPGDSDSDWTAGRQDMLDAVIALVRQQVAHQEAAKPAAEGALEKNVLIGGNHLASALMFIADPLRVGNYDEALELHGQPYADMWIAWKRIMEWRDGTLTTGGNHE